MNWLKAILIAFFVLNSLGSAGRAAKEKHSDIAVAGVLGSLIVNGLLVWAVVAI